MKSLRLHFRNRIVLCLMGTCFAVAPAVAQDPGVIGIQAVNNGPIVPVQASSSEYDVVVNAELRATLQISNPADSYPGGTTVDITPISRNGYFVRGYVVTNRGYVAGSNLTVTIDGNVIVRPIIGRLYEYVNFPAVASIAPDGAVEFEGREVGVPGTIPLAAFNTVLAAKQPLGLAGVVNFDNATTGRNFATGEVDNVSGLAFNFVSMRAVLADANVVEIGIIPEATYVEAGGVANLATADGPGPIDLGSGNHFDIGDGLVGYPGLSFNPGERFPTSGTAAMDGATAFGFSFDAADKVVMAGLVYLGRNNFQHSNPNGVDSIWCEVEYTDGSRVKVSSDQLFQSNAGESDHFFGFEAPAGEYIVGLRLWCRGRNARAFSSIDDFAFVLEGDQSYAVTASSGSAEGGSVSGSGVIADGDSVVISATPNAGFSFAGWFYDGAPEFNFGTGDLSVIAYGPKSLVARFLLIPPAAGIARMGASDLEITVQSRSGFLYQLEIATDGLSDFEPVGSPQAGTGGALTFPRPDGLPTEGAPVFYRVSIVEDVLMAF